jgi:uracil-DNA glycosylase family 4
MSELQNKNCQLCGLHRGVKSVCIAGDGPMDADIVFIGEAPGDQEDKRGVPFIGKSGQIIRTEIEKVGLRKVRITNLVRCRPPANRQPTNDEIKACRPYLDAELEAIKPQYVVTLGNVSSKAVLRKSKITQDHGQLVVGKHPFVGMPMFHPAYILRDPSKLPALQRDLERLAREMRGERRKEEIEWRFLTKSNFSQFVKEFLEAERFSFDTETTGLFMHDPKGRVRTLQIGMDHRVWIIRLYQADSPMPKHETQYNFLHWLEQASRGKWCCAQNGKFDNEWLMAQYGIRFYVDFDVGLAHHLLDENTPHGLKEMSRTYLDAPDYALPLAHLLHPEEHGVLDKFYLYAARDAYYTLRLAILFDGMLKKQKDLRKIFYKLVMPAARCFEDIEMRGITLDMEKFRSTKIEVGKKRDQAEVELNAMAKAAGAIDINWSSPAQVGKFLYGTLKIKPTVLTDGGNYSTGEEALLEIRDEHPIASKLVEFRELSKFYNTYLEGWEQLIVEGRVFFSTKLHGTVTGRYSSRLHQVPRDGTIRNLAIAPPNYTFVQADISQAELRTVAEVSRDPELIKCFKQKIDVHWRTLMFAIQSGGSGDYYEPLMETAAELNGLGDVEDMDHAVRIMMEHGHESAIKQWKGWKEGRKKAKGINFGFVYGMRATKFIEYAKMKYGFEPTMAESETLREAYFHLYRGLEPWHKRQRGLVRLDGQVRNLIGRIRRLPGVHSTDRFLVGEAERQAINSPIQGFIGDWKAMALVEICELPPYSVQVVGEVHDSILLNVRTEELDEWLPKIRSIMRHPKLLDVFNVKLSVPMEADLECGPWGAGTPYRKDLQ